MHPSEQEAKGFASSPSGGHLRSAGDLRVGLGLNTSGCFFSAVLESNAACDFHAWIASRATRQIREDSILVAPGGAKEITATPLVVLSSRLVLRNRSVER